METDVLAQLKALHSQLREAITALERETAKSAPEGETLASARLKLTRISRQRRALIECTICPHFHNAAPDDRRKLDQLRLTSAATQIGSSEHIGRWTTRAIVADWAGYRRASAEMRKHMLRRIAEETDILYPLLGEPRSRAA
jgi:hypothetical protein